MFKCVGVKKEKYIEKVLISESQKLDNGENVPVRIRPEPDNPVDARAIAFECNVSNKWQWIGYIVQEAVEAVHDALKRNLMTEVKFEWIKYIVHWCWMVYRHTDNKARRVATCCCMNCKCYLSLTLIPVATVIYSLEIK